MIALYLYRVGAGAVIIKVILHDGMEKKQNPAQLEGSRECEARGSDADAAVNSPGVTPGQPVFLPHLLNAELLGTVASCGEENKRPHT